MMSPTRPIRLQERTKNLARETMLDVTRDLLRKEGGAGFTMRELAELAGVSPATPYNHFGSKAEILAAILDKRVAEVRRRCNLHGAAISDPIERILTMTRIGVEGWVEDGVVIRRAGYALFEASIKVDRLTRARKLWSDGVTDDFPFRPNVASAGTKAIIDNLATMFRGAFSFWISEDLDDEGFLVSAEAGAANVLLAFADDIYAPKLIEKILLASPNST